MSARRLEIGIRSAADRRRAVREAFRRVRRGDLAAREPELYFESVEELRQILTEKRLQLLTAVLRRRPASVHQLAQLLGRDYKNVSDDVALLSRLGLVSPKSEAGKGRAQALRAPYEEIRVTIDLRHFGEVRAS